MGLVYTNMKIFHFKEKLDTLPIENDKILPPIHVRIKPTNVCNHNCRYCAYRTDALQLGKDMNGRESIPKDRMMEIIDDLVDMQVRALTFSGGGEPFCYVHLLEVVKKLSKTPVKFAALSNGSRLKGEIAEVFAHCGTWLRVSMDGWDDESYSNYRKIPLGEFSRIMDNMEDFKKLGGKCYLGVSLIVDVNNALHVYELIEKLKGAGVDSVKVSPCIVNNDGSKNNQYHEPVFELVKEQVGKAVEDLKDDDFEIHDAYHELDEKFKKEYPWCPYLQILPIIGADLNIYSCQDKAYNLDTGVIGSIKGQRFNEFWFSDKKNFNKIDPSHDCSHHCVANWKNRAIIDYLSADKGHLDFV